LTATKKGLEAEFLAKVKTPDIRIADDLVRAAFGQNLSGIDNIGAIGEPERLADIVIGDQNADAAIGEMPNQILDIADGDRIDAGKGFVEQHVIGTGGQRAGDFDAATLAARERN